MKKTTLTINELHTLSSLHTLVNRYINLDMDIKGSTTDKVDIVWRGEVVCIDKEQAEYLKKQIKKSIKHIVEYWKNTNHYDLTIIFDD